MTTRRELLKWTAASGAGLVVGRGLFTGQARAASAAPTALVASVASTLTPYLDPMPLLVDNAVDATSGGTVNLTRALISRKVHSQLPATTLFGYLRSGGPGAGDTGASYLARRSSPRAGRRWRSTTPTAWPQRLPEGIHQRRRQLPAVPAVPRGPDPDSPARRARRRRF